MAGFEYTKNARKTAYAGVIFRSQLEAQWAALFDIVQIPWNYEPVLLDGWLPDFRLWDRFYAEVKPIPASGYAMATSEYDLIKKAVKRDYTILLGEAPNPIFGCLVTGDGETLGARTILFDPASEFKFTSISGNGDCPHLRDNLKSEWLAARKAIEPPKGPISRRAMSLGPKPQRRSMRR